MNSRQSISLFFLLSLASVGCKGDDQEATKSSKVGVVAEPATKAENAEESEPEVKRISYQTLVSKASGEQGFTPQNVLGSTEKELATKFPTLIEKKDESSSANDALADSLMAGMKADIESMGVQLDGKKNSVEFALPPTKLGSSSRVGISYSDSGKVTDYSISLDIGEPLGEDVKALRAALDAEWGVSKEVDEESVWFDQENGVRVSLRIMDLGTNSIATLGFDSYYPMDDFFGEGDRWGFEKASPLLGASKESLQKEYGTALEIDENGFANIELTKTDYAGGFSHTRIFLSFQKDRVQSWNVEIPHRHYAAGHDEILAKLTEKFGVPKGTKGKIITFSKRNPKISVRDGLAFEVRYEK